MSFTLRIIWTDKDGAVLKEATPAAWTIHPRQKDVAADLCAFFTAKAGDIANKFETATIGNFDQHSVSSKFVFHRDEIAPLMGRCSS